MVFAEPSFHLGGGPPAAIDLSTHIVNLIQWEELSDIVLCGHYAGFCHHRHR
jgi:hypothetical protein